MNLKKSKPIKLTRFTNNNGPIGKRCWIGKNFDIEKKTLAGLADGYAITISVYDLCDLNEEMRRCKKSQAFAYGIMNRDRARVVLEEKLPKIPGAVARNRHHFTFQSGRPGILFLDVDAEHAKKPIKSAEELIEILVKAVPELADSSLLCSASSSSYLIDKTHGLNENLTGLRGQHLYIAIKDASDVPRVGRAIYDRLWLAGYGHYLLSVNGRLLERNIIDASVWQPERLDFVAGASCDPPLSHEPPASRIIGAAGALFDSRVIKSIDSSEQREISYRKTQLQKALQTKSREKRESYISKYSQKLAEKQGLDLSDAEPIIRYACERQILTGSFVLYPDSGDPVTINEILSEPARWHNGRFRDPIEPNYRNDSRIAWLSSRLGGRPILYSHAHGGTRYVLQKAIETITLRTGELSDITDEVLQIAREHGELYDFGDSSIVSIRESHVVPATAIYIQYFIGRILRFQRLHGDPPSPRPANVPDKLAHYILARNYERKFPRLRALITAPTLRADGTILDEPGFDEATGLLYISDDPSPPRVPEHPTTEQVILACQELWQPFREFPFTDNISRAVMMAAILTVVIRPSLPTAPGFGFDAPAAGSGKTLLAKCIAALAGVDADIRSPPDEDVELRKALFSSLRGGHRVIIFDNLTKTLDGSKLAALSAFLTAGKFSDRILGQNDMDSVPNSALLVITGNNLRVTADLCRRFMISRIDPKVETPFYRSFKFDPEARIKQTRMRLVCAALTVIRGWLTCKEQDDEGLYASLVEGSIASYESWDALVRRPVAWLASLDGLGIGLCDPTLSMVAAVAEDPSRAVLGRMLSAWRSAFGDKAKLAAEAWAVAQSGSSDDLDSALKQLSEGDERFDARRLGRWLAVHKDQIVDGLSFADQADKIAHAKRWRVITHEPGMPG